MWLMPYQANNICSVDLDSMKIKYYSFKSDSENEVVGPFHSGVYAGDNIYLIPNKADCVYKIDVVQGIVSEISETQGFNKNIKGLFISDSGFKAVSQNGTILYEMDNSETVTNVCKEDEESGGYISILQKDQEYILIPFSVNEIRKIKENNVIQKNGEGMSSFYRGVNTGEKAILFPAGSNRNIAVVDWNTLECHFLEGKLQDGDNWVMGPNGWFEMQVIPSDEGWWASSVDGFVLEFDKVGEVAGMYHAMIEIEELKKKLDYLYAKKEMRITFNNYVIQESETVGLKQLIKTI
jgi:hypothetical protein